jgi:DmsE family decaheme c-type cytochrome
VKNFTCIGFDLASGESSDKPLLRSSICRPLLYFTAAALILSASLALLPSAKAGNALPQASSQDEAVADLSSFAQQIKADPTAAARRFDNEAFAALQDFAQQLGAAQPQSIKALPKLAEADNIFDAITESLQGGQATPAPEVSKPVVKGKEAPKAVVKGKAVKAIAPGVATYVDGKVCLGCHSSQAALFEKTLMGKIGKTKKGMFECQNCHGPGSEHVKAGGGRGVGGIISFRTDDMSRTPEENNAVCLACHEKGARTNWHGSTHDERNLQCTNCHTIMTNVSRKAQLKTKYQPDTCYQCHKDKRAEEYQTSHMPVRAQETQTSGLPVREGKMVCTDCHNPHGSYTEKLLKQATINDTCYQCHAEKRGPFLWEHPPVQENCLNCHDPHGSNNDFLLKISRPRLCQQCHSGGQHNSNPRNPAVTLYAQGRECQNCHSNHHGSNNPAGARFMR